jgi:hypothetical protein
MNIINSLISGSECDEMRVQLSPFDRMDKACLNGNLFNESLYETIKEISKKEHPKLVLPNEFGSNEKGYNLDLFYLDESTTKKIVAECKLNKVRVTGYFYTVALYALRNLYEENGFKFPVEVPLNVAISLRVRYEPNVDFSHCGFHIAVSVFSTEGDKFGKYEHFWHDAAYINELIQSNIRSDNGTLFSITHDHDKRRKFNQTFAQELYENIENILGPNKIYDLAISNLGTFVNDRVKENEGKFQINELYISDSLQSKLIPALLIHVINWKGKTMFQLGANNLGLGVNYFKRYKHFILHEIDHSVHL